MPLTALRASIIVGSGLASFEIIRDLAEKLPLLITPRWVHTHCQPIAIRKVLDYLIVSQETVCHDWKIREIIPLELLTYRDAVERALARIAQNHVPSSWIDSLAAGTLSPRFFDAIKVPEHGILTGSRTVPLTASREEVIARIWSIGGAAG